MKAIEELEMRPITALKAIASMAINENTDHAQALALCITIAKMELEKTHYCPLCGYEINE